MTDPHRRPHSDDDPTRYVAPPSLDDEERTQVVPPRTLGGDDDGETTRRIDPTPAPPRPASAPPSAPPPGPPRASAPPPAPPGWAPTGAPPPSAPPHQPAPPPYQGYPTPGGHPGAQPTQPGWPGGPPAGGQPPYGGSPAASLDAKALLAKGNSFLARLMYRGIRGQLLPVPFFQNHRRQQPDQLAYASYGIGLLLALVFSLLPGVVSLILTAAVWAALIYVLFAIGTKRAHQFVVFGVCLVGGLLYLGSAILSGLAVLDMLGSTYTSSTLVLSLLILAAGSVVAAAALGFVGWQVHQSIQRMSGRGPAASGPAAPAGAQLAVRWGTATYSFPPVRDVIVGRISDADVHVEIANKKAISRVHVILHPQDGRWTAIDKSHNGIYVNGARMSEVPIDGEVRIALGDPSGPPLDFSPSRG